MLSPLSPRGRGAALAGLILLAAVLLASGTPVQSAPAQVRVTLDGRELKFDVPGQIVDGRVLVPFRGIFEALGATVEWNEARKEVFARRGEDTVKLTIGSRTVEWRRSIIQVDAAPVIAGGRTLVPLRFIAQALGLHVTWDAATRTAGLQAQPADALLARGVKIVHTKSCMVCHTFNGAGGAIGPVLNGVTSRYSETWLRTWLKDPQAVRPGSRMPNFKFTDEDIGAVIAFLKTLEE